MAPAMAMTTSTNVALATTMARRSSCRSPATLHRMTLPPSYRYDPFAQRFDDAFLKTRAATQEAPRRRSSFRSVMPSLRASSVEFTDSNETNESSNPFPQLYGKTLVSIQDCIDAALQQRHMEQQKNRRPEKKIHRRESQDVRSHRTNQTPQMPKVEFVDGSWYHRPDPTTGLPRNPSKEFQSGPRLPKARYFDIDSIATTHDLFPDRNPKRLPHMMPPPKLFGLAMDAFNICNTEHAVDHVVIYARRGAVFTPRTWFSFVSMGHDPMKVHLMQGSLEDWVEHGGWVEDHSLLMDEGKQEDGESWQDPNYATVGEGYADCFDDGILNVTRLYHVRYGATNPCYKLSLQHATNVCGKEEVLDAVNCFLEGGNDKVGGIIMDGNAPNTSDAKTVIIDTRGSGYNTLGHIPSAIHLPYSLLVTPTNSLVLQPKTILETLFEERGIDYLNPKLNIILSCGSGVSVCHGFLALKELGRKITEENTRIYDGSWMEWGREDERLPKVLSSLSSRQNKGVN